MFAGACLCILCMAILGNSLIQGVQTFSDKVQCTNCAALQKHLLCPLLGMTVQKRPSYLAQKSRDALAKQQSWCTSPRLCRAPGPKAQWLDENDSKVAVETFVWRLQGMPYAL